MADNVKVGQRVQFHDGIGDLAQLWRGQVVSVFGKYAEVKVDGLENRADGVVTATVKQLQPEEE